MKIICEHHQSADATYSSKTIRSIFEVKLLHENCAKTVCISLKFEYVGDPSQMRRGLTGTDRRLVGGI